MHIYTVNAHIYCTQMYANLLWRERGSNPRRADYDSTVLPTELSRQRIVQSQFHKHIVSLYLRMFVSLYIASIGATHKPNHKDAQ